MLTDNRALPWLVDLSDYNVQKKKLQLFSFSCFHKLVVVVEGDPSSCIHYYLLLLLN